jgi:hypothetical protein
MKEKIRIGNRCGETEKEGRRAESVVPFNRKRHAGAVNEEPEVAAHHHR